MAAANGIFTYSGAYLYLEEPVYAILFAVAVQFAIAIALLALPYEPLRTLISHIQPLHLEGETQQVGIPFSVVEQESRLKTLLAMLIQSGVLLHRREAECYVLNPAENMAQKVMVFIRMGMRNSPESLLAPAALLLSPEQRQALT